MFFVFSYALLMRKNEKVAVGRKKILRAIFETILPILLLALAFLSAKWFLRKFWGMEWAQI